MRELNRDQLSRFLPDHETIRVFEAFFAAVKAAPVAIESAQTSGDSAGAQAEAAATLARQALEMLAGLADMLEQMSAAPAAAAPPESDEFAPPQAAPAPLDDFTPATVPALQVDVGPDATDLATVITLANNMRAALITNGIAS